MNADDVVDAASRAIFGRPLVTNVYRAILVEAMVANALSDWEWCGADYAEVDFVQEGGLRLEVKQSALRQSWASAGTPRPSWDIAPRKGFYRDETWVDAPGRNADVYVLALHSVTDDTADHRDPSQWQFFVVPTADLPETRTIGLGTLSGLADPVGHGELRDEVIRRTSAPAQGLGSRAS